MLTIIRAAVFTEDFDIRVRWYVGEAGPDLAWAFEKTVDATLEKLARQPTRGRIRRFKHTELRAVRSFAVAEPFGRVLVFYRFDESTLHAWRLMHGARDLPRRLLEPNR